MAGEMSKIFLIFFVVLAFCFSSASAQTNISDADKAAIKQISLDYIEGWYAGDATRMERSLHPELAKRNVQTNTQNGKSTLEQIGAMGLVQGTKAGGAKWVQKEKQQKDIIILDVYENAASVKIDAAVMVDYLHMVKWNGRWVIINALWELKPERKILTIK